MTVLYFLMEHFINESNGFLHLAVHTVRLDFSHLLKIDKILGWIKILLQYIMI